MTNLETQLRESYAADASPTPDVMSLLDGARRQGRAMRRRRRVLAAASAAVVASAAVLGQQLITSSSHHEAHVPVMRLPVPSGPDLTVYRFDSPSGQVRVITFLDTQGRWCVGTVRADRAAGSGGDYQCVDAQLVPGTSGFGRVSTRSDGFLYDGLNQWLQGAATSDVARVTVAMSDGSTRTARLVHAQNGVIFSVRVSWLKTPTFYRAYDARGRLLEQLRVPTSLPNDPFEDWRLRP